MSRCKTGGGGPLSEPWEYDYVIKEMILYVFVDDVSSYDSEAINVQPTNFIEANTKESRPPSISEECIPETFYNMVCRAFEIEFEEQNSPLDESKLTAASQAQVSETDICQPQRNTKAKTGRVLKKRAMTSYEENMLELNRKRIKQAMQHEIELHELQKQKILLEIEQMSN
ncbi:hypothetical protein FQR65_LT18241 [Abscondita terminalis]|nr:hypothetical protein FQR65_LT18241 [Abscondita terminalis]